MQRIASAGVLVVALVLSLMAISRVNSESASGSLTRQSAISAAEGGQEGLIPLVGRDGFVGVVGLGANDSTSAGFVNAAPAIGSHDTRLPERITTTTWRDPKTTTTIGLTTTTTRPSVTTTTTGTPVTTTTAVPVTTTTSGPILAPVGDKFITSVRGTDAAGNSEPWWDAPYFRDLPFTTGAGWTDGDRAGYRCMYAFLLYQGEVVGRVTFTRVPAADSYAAVKDKFMVEGERYYDGTLAPENAPKELGECPWPVADYAPATGSDQRPTITYSTTSGSVLEVRNYKNTVALNGITFRQVESTPQRVTVVAYKDNLPAIVIYYESMVPGVVMNSDLG